MKWKYEKEFRKAHPETIGETDKEFDLDNYKDWLEQTLANKNDLLPLVSNWGDLKKHCKHSVRHSNFMACLHDDAAPSGVCFAPAHCPMIKKWSECNKNSPCC